MRSMIVCIVAYQAKAAWNSEKQGSLAVLEFYVCSSGHSCRKMQAEQMPASGLACPSDLLDCGEVENNAVVCRTWNPHALAPEEP